MTDERRVEVALDVLADADCFCTPENDCWFDCTDAARSRNADRARAVVAALDAHDGDLRERLAAAIEAEEPALFGSPEDPYQRGWSQMRGKAARIVRERP